LESLQEILSWWHGSGWLNGRWLTDVGLVAVAIYQALVLLRGSRSGSVLLAVALLFGVYWLSQDEALDLPTVNWLLDRLLSSIAVLFVVLFADDLKRALSAVVRSPLMSGRARGVTEDQLEEVLRACTVLCEQGVGALMVIEQEASLDRYIEDGVPVSADVTWQLLVALFIPSHRNATHDGAVILRKDKIAAAACFLPLAGGAGIPGTLGSRHRAALGLADETDAVVVVVSEESHTCAIAYMGELDLNLSPADLRERLRLLFGDRRPAGQPWQQAWKRRIQFHPGAILQRGGGTGGGQEPAPTQAERQRPVDREPEAEDDDLPQRPPAPALDIARAGQVAAELEAQEEIERQLRQEAQDEGT
jgi:diadenylate cyclase